MPSEASYQTKLIKKLKRLFPECHIQKNDPAEHQGIPDILILIGGRWAMLEVKKAVTASRQRNQEYHVNKFRKMGFAAFISPENEEQVLNDLQSTFGAYR